MSLSDAPGIVLIVGLLFLVMATMAFIGQKYGQAIPSDYSRTVSNQSFVVSNSGTYVGDANSTTCNLEDFTVSSITNNTGYVLNTANYTVYSNGRIGNATSMALYGTTLRAWYSYSYAGTACDVTNDLQTEISNNTSIAGIVLTISLVGIVLSILVGVFLAVRRNRV